MNASANGTATPRMGLEDTLHAILDNLQQTVTLLGLEVGDHGSDRVSSVTVENMAKGPPKITTHFYAGSPLSRGDVDDALDIHAYAFREAERRSLEQWKDTVDLLKDRVLPEYPAPLEQLPDFESTKAAPF